MMRWLKERFGRCAGCGKRGVCRIRSESVKAQVGHGADAVYAQITYAYWHCNNCGESYLTSAQAEAQEQAIIRSLGYNPFVGERPKES